MEALFFWIFAVGLIGFGLAVVLSRNPVGAALSLAATFVFQAALYVTLGAYFLAAVQVIVYAGAVMVLFLFIIMLLDIKAEAHSSISMGRLIVAGASSILFAVIFSKVLCGVQGLNPEVPLQWSNDSSPYSWVVGAGTVGQLLFTEYYVPFLATAVLLLVATLGVVILSKKDLT